MLLPRARRSLCEWFRLALRESGGQIGVGGGAGFQLVRRRLLQQSRGLRPGQTQRRFAGATHLQADGKGGQHHGGQTDAQQNQPTPIQIYDIEHSSAHGDPSLQMIRIQFGLLLPGLCNGSEDPGCGRFQRCDVAGVFQHQVGALFLLRQTHLRRFAAIKLGA